MITDKEPVMSTIPPGGGNSSTTHIEGVAQDLESEVENKNNNNAQRQTVRGPSIHNTNGTSIKDRFKKGIKAVDSSETQSVRQSDSNGNRDTDESQSADQ